MRLLSIFSIVIILFFVFSLSAQSNLPSGRVTVGGGLFTVNADEFEIIYGTNRGYTYGAGFAAKLFDISKLKAWYIALDFNAFNKSGEMVDSEYQGTDIDTEWKQSFTHLGLHHIWKSEKESTFYNWLGGGYAVSKVSETSKYISSNERGNGYYLEGGIGNANNGFTTTMLIRWSSIRISGDGGIGGSSVNVGGLTAFFNVGINF